VPNFILIRSETTQLISPLEEARLNSKNNNMGSDMGSVPDPKIVNKNNTGIKAGRLSGLRSLVNIRSDTMRPRTVTQQLLTARLLRVAV